MLTCQGSNAAALTPGQALRVGVSYKIQNNDGVDGLEVLAQRLLTSSEVCVVRFGGGDAVLRRSETTAKRSRPLVEFAHVL